MDDERSISRSDVSKGPADGCVSVFAPGSGGEERTHNRGCSWYLVDYGSAGSPIGIEIIDPSRATATVVNRVLAELGIDVLDPRELGPLQAA